MRLASISGTPFARSLACIAQAAEEPLEDEDICQAWSTAGENYRSMTQEAKSGHEIKAKK
jgi:hypothetical protein